MQGKITARRRSLGSAASRKVPREARRGNFTIFARGPGNGVGYREERERSRGAASLLPENGVARRWRTRLCGGEHREEAQQKGWWCIEGHFLQSICADYGSTNSLQKCLTLDYLAVALWYFNPEPYCTVKVSAARISLRKK